MKLIVTKILTDLATNSPLSFFFCPFLQTKKQESGFPQIGGLATRNISVCQSSALLQSHDEFNRFYKQFFVHVIPAVIVIQ